MPPGFLFLMFISFQCKAFERQVAPCSVGRAVITLMAGGIYRT